MARAAPNASQQAAAAASPSSPGAAGPSWGTDSNTAGGGVWAQASAKKEKLNELLTELNANGVDTATNGMETLDEAASAQERLDLEFADGLKMIAKFVDDGMKDDDVSDGTQDGNNAAMGREASLAAEESFKQLFQLLESASSVEEWEKPKFEATMHEAIRILSTGLPEDPNLKKPVAGSLDTSHPLCYMREFVDESESDDIVETEKNENLNTSSDDDQVERRIRILNELTAQAFSSSTRLYRTLLLRATARALLEGWDTITAVTSGDIDRAAVSKTTIPPQRSAVNAEKVRKLFDAYANGSSTDWVQSWWNLIDADEDGLIDEEELTSCVELAIKPVHSALSDLVLMSLEVCPVRSAGLGSNEANAWLLGGDNIAENIDDVDISNSSNPSAAANLNNKLSWRNRRRELKARKALVKTFQATLARHFRDQAELPHRLRCIYAWADKSHQDNKLDSILVDASEDWGAASSIVGRKRYVELEPKISYPEFRNEQEQHFQHLDKIGEEIVMSFKEDLWVLQGKGRQNKELKRDCFLFLSAVSLVDVGIIML